MKRRNNWRLKWLFSALILRAHGRIEYGGTPTKPAGLSEGTLLMISGGSHV